MEELNLIKDKQNSITLKKGAKGYLWDIKVYFDDDKDKALSDIEHINSLLKASYE